MSVRDESQFSVGGSQGQRDLLLEQALANALELLGQKERELAEARRSEDRYRSLVEKVMDLVFCVDREGRFTFVNSAVLSLLEYRPEELLGQHFLMILTEESKPVALEHFKRNIQGHGPRLVYELEMLTKSGRRVPVDVHGTNVHEEGEVVGVRGIARDVSHRRQAEERQQHRLSQLRTINRVGQQITSVLSIEELLPSIADLVRTSFGYSNVNVFLRDETGEQMVLRATSTSYRWPLPLGTALRVGEQGMVGWVGGVGEPLLANDVSREPRYYATQELQLTQSELTVPIKLAGQIVGVLDIESDRMDAFDEADLWAAQTLADQIAVALRNADLFQAERKTRRETALILEITRAVNSTLLLDEVLRVAADCITSAVGVPNCGMYLVDDAGTKLIPRGGTDSPLSRLIGELFMATPLDIPSDRFLSQVVETKQPTVCADAETDPSTDKGIVAKFHIKSLLAVPFVSRDRVLGMAMVTAYQDFHQFSPDTVELADGIANSVAMAIENARLYERTHDLAVMEERNRLAREIHDTIAQGLTGIVLQLEAADYLMEGNPDRARMRIHKATELARSSLQEARRSVWNLRPTPLEEKRLADAMRQEIDLLVQEAGLRATFEVSGDPAGLSGETENGLYRIVQEALNNVRKHARASEIQLILCIHENEIEIRIRDDGVGFDPEASRPAGAGGGFGLLGLQERARLLGGSAQVKSSPGIGTLVEVRVPIRR